MVLQGKDVDRQQVTMQESEQPVAVGAPGGDPLGMLGRRKLRNRDGLGSRRVWQMSAV